jgi:hypothetical protein
MPALYRPKPIKQRRMAYGFVIDWAAAAEQGRGDFNPALCDTPQMTYVKSMMRECRVIWPNTKIQPVDLNRNILACIVLAENTSQRAMQLPSQHVVDQMKHVLQATEDPKWYKYYG